MLPLFVLLLPLVAAASCPEGCTCARLSGGGREVDCGLLKATLRPPNLEVQCNGQEEFADEDFALLKTFGAASSVNFKGCPLPPLSGLINASAVESLVVQNALQTLNLSAVHFDGFKRLRQLQLSDSGITELPEGTFNHLAVLERLNLRGNKLRALPTLPSTLVALELGQNLLTTAPQGLPKLKLLGLWKNRFGALAPLSDFPALEFLDLNSNGLHAVATDAFAALPSLKKINLSKNRVRALPPGIFNQNKLLNQFRMSDNEGDLNLPNEFLANLPNLTEVLIERSSLAAVPEDMFRNATALVNLTISNCKLDTVPTGFFQDCKLLQRVDLSGNKLSNVPEFSQNNAKLHELKLNKNNILTIGDLDLRPLVGLKSLEMSSNGLETVDKNAFEANSALRHVSMDHNALSFSEMTRDYFGSYSPFHFCTALETLSLRNNSISDVFADWKISLLHLEKLDLRQNYLSVLSTEDLQFLTSNIIVDMRQNNITIIDLRHIVNLAIANDAPTLRNVSVKVDGAAIDCSQCSTHSLLRYLEGGLHPAAYKYVRLEVDRSGSCMANLTAKDFLCPLPHSQCQEECSCNHRPENRAILLDCKFFPPHLSLKAKGKTVEISLVGKNISGNFSAAAYDVAVLRLNANRIERLVSLPPALEEVDLSQNRLRHISKKLLDQMNETQRITLASNPWACDCDALDLLAFVQRRFRAISDLSNVTCEDGRPLARLSADELCNKTRVAVAASLAVAVAGIVLGALAAIYYKFQHQIKVWLYAHNLLLWLVTEAEVDKDKKYDAFVSYSHKDESFVAHKLLPGLEPQFKLCIHARDWNAGDWIPDQIARSVEESRRTLVILSPSFMESVWGRMEFRAAHQQAMSEGRARVVVILLQDVGPLDKLDPELRAYLTMNTYLQWGDPGFWAKLRYAMPHRKLKGERPKGPRPLAIKINDKLEQMQHGI